MAKGLDTIPCKAYIEEQNWAGGKAMITAHVREQEARIQQLTEAVKAADAATDREHAKRVAAEALVIELTQEVRQLARTIRAARS